MRVVSGRERRKHLRWERGRYERGEGNVKGRERAGRWAAGWVLGEPEPWY